MSSLSDPFAWILVLLFFGSLILWSRRRVGGTDETADPRSREERAVELWLDATASAEDAVAYVSAPGAPPQVNTAWRNLFGNTVPDRLLPWVDKGTPAKTELQFQRPELSLPEPTLPLGGADIRPVRVNISTDGGRAVIVVPCTRAHDLALHSRQIAHNFNNILSAVVGGAGMVMDAVPEGSQEFQDLEQIEDAAMRAAELTAELQRVAREVAPPEAEL